MNTPEQNYSQTADELVNRIVALIPENLNILELDSPWNLFEVNGFKCDDIGPSLFQAQRALAKAKSVYNQSLHRAKKSR